MKLLGQENIPVLLDASCTRPKMCIVIRKTPERRFRMSSSELMIDNHVKRL